MKYLLLIGLILSGCTGGNKRLVCVSKKTVMDVGRCNEAGSCGVMYTDRTFGINVRPVRGALVCVQYEWVEIK